MTVFWGLLVTAQQSSADLYEIGADVILRCNSSTTRALWMHNKHLISDQWNGTLVIRNATCRANGDYLCVQPEGHKNFRVDIISRLVMSEIHHVKPPKDNVSLPDWMVLSLVANVFFVICALTLVVSTSTWKSKSTFLRSARTSFTGRLDESSERSSSSIVNAPSPMIVMRGRCGMQAPVRDQN